MKDPVSAYPHFSAELLSPSGSSRTQRNYFFCSPWLQLLCCCSSLSQCSAFSYVLCASPLSYRWFYLLWDYPELYICRVEFSEPPPHTYITTVTSHCFSCSSTMTLLLFVYLQLYQKLSVFKRSYQVTLASTCAHF